MSSREALHDAPGHSRLKAALVPRDRIAIAKIFIAAACLAPFAIVIAKIAGLASFGPHPVQEILHGMGKTGLNLLLITLAITPARKLTKQNWLIRLRRMLGLFAFFYLVLHLLAYAALDLRLDFATLGTDIVERPYITVGMLAIVLLIPLAVTSTRGWQRRLGRNWTRLHRLVYVCAVLGVIHFWWQVKADIREPLLYALMLAALLGYRAADAWRRRRRRSAVAAAASAAR